MDYRLSVEVASGERERDITLRAYLPKLVTAAVGKSAENYVAQELGSFSKVTSKSRTKKIFNSYYNFVDYVFQPFLPVT